MDWERLERLRAQLEEDRQQQLSQLELFGADPYGGAVTNLGNTEEAGFADSAQITEQRSEALAQIDQARSRLQQIDEALERLKEGTYGICVECGTEINPARLEARPLSIRCVECAAKAG
ncbi:MAG: TraR/DksA family transcriptional regulator [Actinomycetota bacterium]|nr:TraR/DksA family transcriptional regulator [Actinomycetota bacterium]